MSQTTALAVPSVVVAMGAVGPPVMAAHQSATGFGGDPAGTDTAMTTWPPAPPGHCAPPSVENVTRWPIAVLYAAGTVWIDMAPVDTMTSASGVLPSLPPRFAGSSRKKWPSFEMAASRLAGVAPGTPAR